MGKNTQILLLKILCQLYFINVNSAYGYISQPFRASETMASSITGIYWETAEGGEGKKM